jgi:hypothetical protein
VNWLINGAVVGTAVTNIPAQPMALSLLWLSGNYAGSSSLQIGGMSAAVNGSVYLSADGLTVSAVQYKDSGSPSTCSITVFLDGQITEHDVRARLYDSAQFQLCAVNYADPSMGSVKLLSGSLGEIKMENGMCTIELRGLAQALATTIPSVYGPTCRADWGDVPAVENSTFNHWRCSVDRRLYTTNGTVGSSPDSLTVVPMSGGSPPVTLLMVGSLTPTLPAPVDWFADGQIHFSTGVLTGYSFEIQAWDGTTLSLFPGAPMPFSPSAGDAFTIEPGCNHLKSDCFGKFNNIVNFAGEAEIPGINILSSSGLPQVQTR